MKTAAIVGASSNRAKWGNKALRAFLQRGYTVYPVNPNEPEVEGFRTFRSLRDLPVSPEVITLYVPPTRVLELLPEIQDRGYQQLWLNPGTASDEVRAEARRRGMDFIEGCSIMAIGVSPISL